MHAPPTPELHGRSDDLIRITVTRSTICHYERSAPRSICAVLTHYRALLGGPNVIGICFSLGVVSDFSYIPV